MFMKPVLISSVQQTERFHALDSVRGFLALSVAVGHLVYWMGRGAHYPLSFILSVDFFFVLSGFVLAHSFYSARDKAEWIRRFPIRRAVRLFPLYAVCVVTIYSLFAMFKGLDAISGNTYTLAAWLLMLQGTGLVPVDLGIAGGTPMGIAWALSIEMWVALLVFMLVYILHEKTATLLLIFLFLYAVCGVVLETYSPHFMNVHYDKIGAVPFGVLRGIIGFGLGIVAYLIRENVNRPGNTTWAELDLSSFCLRCMGRSTMTNASTIPRLSCSWSLLSYSRSTRGPSRASCPAVPSRSSALHPSACT